MNLRAVLAVAPLALAPMADAQTIVPVQQARSVRAFVTVPPCEPASDSRFIAAPDFGPFSETAAASLECPPARGDAVATQLSILGPTSITAEGDSTSGADASFRTVIHAIGGSIFDVTFDLPQRARVDLSGLLGISGGIRVQIHEARVALSTSGSPIFERRLDPAPDGSPRHLPFGFGRTLDAGRYRVYVAAHTLIDTDVTFAINAHSAFALVLDARPECRADFNDDGQVDFFDYLDFVQAFAAGNPIADFNGDGQVDFFDYLDFVGAFSEGCPG